MVQSLTVRDAIIQRRSIKLFNGQPVDREELLSIMEDAVWAPNHQLRQPWRFIVACGKELDDLYSVLKEFAVPKWKELSEEDLEKQMKKFTTPGGYVFVVVPEDARQKERLEDYAAASMLVQNIQLLAWDRGIGSCWKTPGYLDNPLFRKALGIQPGERIISMLQVGYFDEMPKPKDRKGIEDLVTIFEKKD
ncbi:Nitroreductase [Paenisporosarcina quisquiliarum]|jgi:nitroreductase|uniref:nitroreductase family protein n=1 Tax=Psychrobacillus TaxID=1221880 RepID=UPI0008C80D2B|nr:nitroreductase [Psychrobacillus psychrodurans]MCK1995615.1 nitroreductase [Psychrobacillus psychrodurans]MCZ8538880.1 nitroreductase [Psychrobacillus psychrodurans]SEM67936.1 Nitroreductase [Paenisporosarcina quisquiliarum]SFM24053.1 Nitroreductase [Psychrobacillus psychrodurans]